MVGGRACRTSSSLPRLGHKDHLRGLVPDCGSVKVAILCRNLEPAPRQKVLDLVSEEIPQRPGKHQPLLTAVLMPDGENHFHVIPLFRTMTRRHSLADAHLPAVRRFVFRDRHLLHVYGVVHAFGIGLERVEDEPPAWRKMLTHAIQAIYLLLHF